MFGIVTAPQGSTPQYTADQIKPIEAVLRADARGRRVDGDLRLPDRRRRQRGAAPEAVGRAHETQQQIADELRPKFAAIPGAIAFPINPPSLGQSFRSTPIEYVIMSQIPYADLQRLVDRFLDEARKYPGHAEPADRPAAQHAGSARAHQPRQAVRHRRAGRHRRPHARDDARRAAGHALQARRRAVRRDRAGRAARPHDAGRHQRQLRARARRQHGAAVESRRRQAKASRRSRSTTSTACAR